jgi:hypothetical protein
MVQQSGKGEESNVGPAEGNMLSSGTRAESSLGTFGTARRMPSGDAVAWLKSHYSLSCLNASNLFVPDRSWSLS